MDVNPSESVSLDDAWQRIVRNCDKMKRAWLKSSKPLTVHDSTVMIAVPNDFTRDRIESRLRPEIEEQLSDVYRRQMHLAITIEPDLELDLAAPEPEPEPELDDNELIRSQNPPASPMLPSILAGDVSSSNQPDERAADIRLNPKYTFDNFVIGNSNRFAHAAAVAVAESPGKAYNPLLIYGDSGLGKTHLLHALGHYVLNFYENARVLYVSTEELTNDFINAISENRTTEFRRTYRELDLLLIDDIQFLESKIQTQEEFFHTFNTLHNAQKQIVMTSDRPPKALEALEPRLRSRFEMGLLTDIQPPDLETRIAILKRKAIGENLSVPDDVLVFIASRIATNIRELEGALIRVTAFASLNRQPVDMELAESVLRDLIPDDTEVEVDAQRIISETADYYGFEISQLTGSSRTKSIVMARQIAMYLCRELTDLSLPKIGQEFGGKDHTTVMYADRKIRELMSEKRTIYNQITELTNTIKRSGTK